MREIELKARVADLVKLKSKLTAMKIVLSEPVSQKDVVYGKRQGEGWVHGEQWFRVRTEQGKKHILTMKRTLGAGLDSLEHESVVTDPEAIVAILADLGFEYYCTLTKIRQKATWGDIELCLDSVPELAADFIEVEKLVAHDADHDQVVIELHRFLAELSIDTKDEITEGYDVLLLKLQGKPF